MKLRESVSEYPEDKGRIYYYRESDRKYAEKYYFLGGDDSIEWACNKYISRQSIN